MRFKLVKECALFFGACLGGGTVTRATLQMTDSLSVCVSVRLSHRRSPKTLFVRYIERCKPLARDLSAPDTKSRHKKKVNEFELSLAPAAQALPPDIPSSVHC